MSEKRFIKTGKIDESKFEKFEKIPVMIEAYQTDEEVEIETLEGVMKANKGDWIIKGVKGELYPCKPDVFDLTYTKVENKMINKRFTIKIQGNKAEEIYIGIVDNLDNTTIPLIEKGDYLPSGINYVVEKLNHLNDIKKKYPNFEVIKFNIKDEDKINELKNNLIAKKKRLWNLQTFST